MKSQRLTWVALLAAIAFTPRAEADDDKGASAKSGVHGRVYGMDPKSKGLTRISGATIELVNEAGRTAGQTTSDKRGYYSLKVPAGTYYYKVSAAGYRDEQGLRGFSLQLTDGDAIQNFTLQPGKTDPGVKPPEIPRITVGQLRGQVYEKTAKGELRGVNGASVTLRKVGSTSVVVVHASPPTEGQSSSGYLRELEAGKWQISVRADGFDSHVEPEPVAVAVDKMAIQDMILTRPPEPVPKSQGLSGSVVLAGESPGVAPAIRVTVRRLAPPETTTPVQPDAQGAFKTDTAPGRYVVSAEADGYVPAPSAIGDVLPGRYTNVSLKLQRRPASLLVRVFSEATKKPLGEVRVRVRRPDEDLAKATQLQTDATGQTLFTSTAAGTFQVLAQMPGYTSGGKTIELKAAGDQVDLYLTPNVVPTTALTVRAMSATLGTPLSGVAIRVQPAPAAAGTAARTDAKGFWSGPLNGAGRYMVEASVEGYEPARQELTANVGANTLRFDMTPLASPPTPKTGRLLVDVVQAGATTPIAAAHVLVSPTRDKGDGRFDGLTDGRGKAFTRALPLQTYSLQVERDGFETSRTVVTLAEGDNPKTISLTRMPIAPTLRTLNVLVREGGVTATKPIEGAVVRILNAKLAVVKTGKTNDLGRFRADDMEAGVYTVEASKVEYTLREKPRTVITRDDVQQEVSLYRSAGPPLNPPQPEYLTVPDVTGRQLTQVRQAVEAARLTFRAADERIVAGKAKSQLPAAGSKVKPGTAVVVTFEGAPMPTERLVAVPDLKGKANIVARRQLESLGLVAKYKSDRVESRDLVAMQTPVAGTRVASGTGVILEFAEMPDAPMPPDKLAVIPDLKGKSNGEARRLLLAAGLMASYKNKVDEGAETNAKVTKQTPAAGAKVASGSKVSLEFEYR